jgi:hypothetical protein
MKIVIIVNPSVGTYIFRCVVYFLLEKEELSHITIPFFEKRQYTM